MIAQKTGFSADTISKHLKEMKVKEEKEAPEVGGAVDINAEFEAFKSKRRLEEMREGLKSWIENEILSLNPQDAGDLRENLEWIYNRINKAQSEDELYELSALAMQNTVP